jgi:Ca-activated chloride channel family protein
MNFEYPWLGLLLIIPAFQFLHFLIRGRRQQPAVSIPGAVIFSQKQSIFLSLVRDGLRNLLWAALLSCLVIAAMNPRESVRKSEYNTYGVDIVLCLDISESMKADDIRPNRITAAKATLADFIRRREGDRLGLVIFGSAAYVQAPQTLEYSALQTILDQVRLGNKRLGSATAIGDALSVAGSRLLDSQADSRIILLITDGKDTASERIRPMAATEALREMGIRIYTIGMGLKTGGVDFKLLEKIAATSGGRFYRARSRKDLQALTRQIDSLEKSIVGLKNSYMQKDQSPQWFTWGFWLFYAWLGLSIGWPRRPEVV